jgi:anaerobic ribonucleoside-triphosphate reductase activating protein
MLKYVNTGVVFQEIPDEVTLAINIANCPCRCPGCHSPYLWDDIGIPLDATAIDEFVHRFSSDITCIALMGGDADPMGVDLLAQYIHEEYPLLKVAWYSGRLRVPPQVTKTDFDYIKIGPYIRHLGPLNLPTTNQRMYRKCIDGTFEDITYRFWKNEKVASM